MGDSQEEEGYRRNNDPGTVHVDLMYKIGLRKGGEVQRRYSREARIGSLLLLYTPLL